MNLEAEQMGEMMAHVYQAYQLGLVLSERIEQRDRKRLEKARLRLNQPTTHEQNDAPPLQRRSA